MGLQTWVTVANAYQFNSVSEGIKLEKSLTATDISPGGKAVGEAFTTPAGFINPGAILRFTAMGLYETTAAPELELGLYYGGITTGKALAASKFTQSETVVEIPWRLEACTRVLPFAVQPAAEAMKSAKTITQGIIFGMGKSTTNKGGVGEPSVFTNLPLKAPKTEVAIDLTAQNIWTVGAKWVTESASNNITCLHWYVELFNN